MKPRYRLKNVHTGFLVYLITNNCLELVGLLHEGKCKEPFFSMEDSEPGSEMFKIQFAIDMRCIRGRQKIVRAALPNGSASVLENKK